MHIPLRENIPNGEDTSDNARSSAQSVAAQYDELALIWKADQEDEIDQINIEELKWIGKDDMDRFLEDPQSYLGEEALELKFKGAWSFSDKPSADQAVILDAWGGPAVQTIVDFNEEEAWVEGQDWFTPWVPVAKLSGDAYRMLFDWTCAGIEPTDFF